MQHDPWSDEAEKMYKQNRELHRLDPDRALFWTATLGHCHLRRETVSSRSAGLPR